MINRLRRKLVLVAMSSLFGVLTFLVITFNMLMYHEMMDDLSQIFEVIFENNGEFPEEERFNHKDEGIDNQWMNEETWYETRFFAIQVDESNQIIFANIDNVIEISAEDAKDVALEILETGKRQGFYEVYRYEIRKSDKGEMIVFINCYHELNWLYDFFWASTGVVMLTMGAVFLLVVIFSNRAVYPIVESYKKQKRFITDSNHEIKTPLAVIQANTDLIEIMQGENEWTQSIKKQVERLNNLTQSMTELARMDEEDGVSLKEWFSISQVVEEMYEAFSSLAQCRRKAFDIDIEEGVQYWGNKKLIGQLLSILLDNAMKYSETYTTIGLCKRRGKIHLHVINDVVSIDKDKLESMFNRFYRGDASRNSQVPGFGIGLSIAKAIVENHHGKIGAKSEEGNSVDIHVVL